MTEPNSTPRDGPDLLIEGMSLEQMIAAPLVAATAASSQMAGATAEFIRTVGLDEGSVRQVHFDYERPVEQGGPDAGTPVVMQPARVTLPLLAMVPIPALQIDTLTTSFTVEVHSARAESESDQVIATADPGVPTVRGRPTSHREHVRNSDKTAKYSFELTASAAPPPEALARVLDLMAQAVAPRPSDPPAEPPARKSTRSTGRPRAPRKPAPPSP